eukprot:TRINITY_DN5467_c0_g1_i1.p1 TRINITY_DN5467_c0_g1~~TRINITY_DN5467_c0_g1_i1.p1  ORF type:complete len:389 (+),score=197.41 TRINITY_DN5467_c0_g1_i1:63-1229(+)
MSQENGPNQKRNLEETRGSETAESNRPSKRQLLDLLLQKDMEINRLKEMLNDKGENDEVPPKNGEKMDENLEKLSTVRREEPKILEKGHIYFFYRPKVTLEEAHNLDEVQRFYILLSPNTLGKESDGDSAASSQSNHRIIIIPKKVLPDAKQHEKFYGIVAKVTDEPEELRKSLGTQTYNTSVRGETELEAARILGQGIYAIVEQRNQTHLCYVLEFPEDLTEAQQVFQIKKESSFQLSVKNPLAPTPSYLGNLNALIDLGTGFNSTNDRVKEFPENLQSQFRGNRWCPCNSPQFLDQKGAEFLFIGANDDLVDQFGKEMGEYMERVEQEDLEREKKEDKFEDNITIQKRVGDSNTYDGLKESKKNLAPPIILGSQWNISAPPSVSSK